MPVNTSSKTTGRPLHDFESLEVVGIEGFTKEGFERIVEMSWRWKRGSLWGFC